MLPPSLTPQGSRVLGNGVGWTQAVREEDGGAIVLVCAFPYRRAQHPSSRPRAGKAPHSQLLFSTALLLFFRVSSSAPPSGAQSTLGVAARGAPRTRGSALRGKAGPLPGLPRLGGPQAGARGSWPRARWASGPGLAPPVPVGATAARSLFWLHGACSAES